MAKWIAKATSKHKGALRKQAKAAGRSTSGFVSHVMANKGHYSSQTVKRAALARTLMRMHH